MVTGEDVGGLGHEVHTAEHDVLGLGPFLGQHRQAERVAPCIGPAHDLVTLVVVAEDEQPVAQGGLGRRDAVGELHLGRLGVPLRQR